LSLLRFSIVAEVSFDHDIDFESIDFERVVPLQSGDIFTQTKLKDLRSLEFPFSDDPFDFYTLSLKSKEIIVNQYTGEILSELNYPIVQFYTDWMTLLHTGEGSIFWSFVLMTSSMSVLFFIYSGFAMTLMRRKHGLKSEYDASDSEYIVLVGSETGTTMGFANLFYQKLLSAGAKAFIGQMNDIRPFPSMKQLIIFTATYGKGEPPANAEKFEEKLKAMSISKPFGFSVVGFGSMAYPDFCRFAFDVDSMLEEVASAKREKAPSTVNNRSWDAFKEWACEWGMRFNLNLSLPTEFDLNHTLPERTEFEIISKTSDDDDFLLELKPRGIQEITSGDLLAVTPPDGSHDRLYSIGVIESQNLIIAVKKIPGGVCSRFLNGLDLGESLKSVIIRNESFYIPEESDEVLMISTGTGIAPFLGMIENNNEKKQITLLWGGKTRQSFNCLYQERVENGFASKKLFSFQMALSRENGMDKTYVQDLLTENAERTGRLLHKGGAIMVCGSIAMQNGVIEVLESICKEYTQEPLKAFKNRKQIRMDCY
jgi:sulfite reductase (NADPH) flavoprotein alpha-component